MRENFIDFMFYSVTALWVFVILVVLNVACWEIYGRRNKRRDSGND